MSAAETATGSLLSTGSDRDGAGNNAEETHSACLSKKKKKKWTTTTAQLRFNSWPSLAACQSPGASLESQLAAVCLCVSGK